MTLLERLNIQLFIQGGLEGDSQHNHYCMMLLRHFYHIHTLDLLITYPPVSPFLCHRSNVSIDNEENIESQLKEYSKKRSLVSV
jgi:hypothetical protein